MLVYRIGIDKYYVALKFISVFVVRTSQHVILRFILKINQSRATLMRVYTWLWFLHFFTETFLKSQITFQFSQSTTVDHATQFLIFLVEQATLCHQPFACVTLKEKVIMRKHSELTSSMKKGPFTEESIFSATQEMSCLFRIWRFIIMFTDACNW